MDNNLSMFIMFGMFAMMMWFSFRSQKKQREQRLTMLNAMKPGDKVVTIGGLYGVIDSIDTEVNTVVLDIDGVYLTFERTAIRTVVPGEPSQASVLTEQEGSADSAIEE